MRRVDARRALALLGAGVLLAIGASEASWASSTDSADSTARAVRSSTIGAAPERSALDVTEAVHESEPAAIGRSSSESSRPPIGYVALAAVVAAAFAFPRRTGDARVRSIRMLVSRLGSRAPPALSLI
jgi:hypothetical protein